MPNQRKKGKTRIAVWLTQAQREALNRAIKSGAAKDMSDFVLRAIGAETIFNTGRALTAVE